MILAARGLGFAYGAGLAPAVAEVDLELAEDEILALVGPNGAGKSTLLALLAGWQRPQAGTVELEGRPLESWPARQRARRLAFLPQQVAPLYDLSVIEVVMAGRHPHRAAWAPPATADRAAVVAAMAATDTAPLARRAFATLSGGERQRVLVASVLAQDPRALLLDEPTASLDQHHRVQVFRLLRAAADGGRGVAVVTHDLNLAALAADRVALLVGGRLERVGTPAEVLRQEVLEAAYGPELVVVPHPRAAGRPAVLPGGLAP